ncbi:PaaI family thioesterase [Hymenobacter sp. GOD-10R]|uniref:PaaI family thioesterase n=1 Tax=Hymenobacter sp. GOD-10R TaxID=3093922 RepID=UPI002D78E0A5|nr:DUF4442 domain-containing protein [Hymenobacter sp. GOD-10R]WRQ29469.1 DUF4442 domain-containing protein [Hymenobacter sp. GOD-10R]
MLNPTGAVPPTSADTPQKAAFRRDILNPLKLRIFMLRRLPMAYLAGLRVRSLTEKEATVTVPFKYLTKNPFRSIYFACLAMAAELASGVQALMHVSSGSPTSMLVTGLEATFMKKAVGLITFTCPDGASIEQAVAESRATGEARTVVATSTGLDAAGDTVAVFRITWSFRARQAGR